MTPTPDPEPAGSRPTWSRTARHVAVLGAMGAGKTTTARALGERLGWDVRDNDRDLEARTGRTGAELAAVEGLTALHALEAELLLDALASTRPTVVAAASSVVDAAPCRAALSDRALTVWLDAPAAALAARRASGRHRRRLLPEAAAALAERRGQRLAAVADLHLDARAPTADLVAAIVALVRDGAARGPHVRGDRR